MFCVLLLLCQCFLYEFLQSGDNVSGQEMNTNKGFCWTSTECKHFDLFLPACANKG